MTRTTQKLNNKIVIKLPIMDLEHPVKLSKPVVMVPEEEYKEMLEDLDDLRSALKAEEEYLAEGGRLFSDYDKQRRKTR